MDAILVMTYCIEKKRRVKNEKRVVERGDGKRVGHV